MHQLLIKYRENKCNAWELEWVLAYLKTKEDQRHLVSLMDKDVHTIVHSGEDEQKASHF